MDIIAGSQNDEFYTPPWAVTPILKYIPKGSKIWCPFDTHESFFVKLAKAAGFNVIYSHLTTGHDFFKANLKNVDAYIISNPPYTLKTEVLDVLFTAGSKFAMLVGVIGLFESQKRFNMFSAATFEIMYFNRRISYLASYHDTIPKLNPPFSSVYICSGVLPKQIVFETVVK